MPHLRRLVRIVTAALILAAVVVVAQPAHAADGGCGGPRVRSGFSITACNSDDGVWVYGDMYVNSVGSGFTTCYVEYEIWDGTTNKAVAYSGKQSCYLGRHPSTAALKVPGHIYRTEAFIGWGGPSGLIGGLLAYWKWTT